MRPSFSVSIVTENLLFSGILGARHGAHLSQNVCQRQAKDFFKQKGRVNGENNTGRILIKWFQRSINPPIKTELEKAMQGREYLKKNSKHCGQQLHSF